MQEPLQQQTPIGPKVLSVHHWNESLFSFRMERPQSFRFEPGQFVMIGLPGDDGKPIMRAYSVASPSWDEELEFFSIKVDNGPLTSRLQKITQGDVIILGSKPTGTLVHSALLPGKNLFLFGSGTGLAPWMSIIRDAETYRRFDHVYVCHGVRHVNDLAYREYLEKGIFEDEMVQAALEVEGIEGGLRGRLTYYPTVTREAFRNQGRLTDLTQSGKLFSDLGLVQACFDPASDRVMICGSIAVNKDMSAICVAQGLSEGATNKPGGYVVERAFVEK